MSAHAKHLPWQVVQQHSNDADQVMSEHRFAVLAWWRKLRLDRAHNRKTGVHFDVRRTPAVAAVAIAETPAEPDFESAT